MQGLDWQLVHLFTNCQPSQQAVCKVSKHSTYTTQHWTSVTAQYCLPFEIRGLPLQMNLSVRNNAQELTQNCECDKEPEVQALN